MPELINSCPLPHSRLRNGNLAQQVYSLACQFGVGYRTMIIHLSCALGSIGFNHADELRKFTPKTIRAALFPGQSNKDLELAASNAGAPRK